jgi:hypothetical protein
MLSRDQHECQRSVVSGVITKNVLVSKPPAFHVNHAVRWVTGFFYHKNRVGETNNSETQFKYPTVALFRFTIIT